MKYLSDARWNVVSLNDLVSSMVEKTPIPPKTIVLTFDDGFQNFYTSAFPVLAQYEFKGTVFLVTDYCNKYNDWAGNPQDLPRSKLLSWQEIKELHKLGMDFGSHTRTHHDLRKMSQDQVKSELVESRLAIEDALGCEAATFAYPFGSYNAAVKQAVEETFVSASSTKLGKVSAGSDRFSLERIDSYYVLNHQIFNLLASTSFDQYLKIRRVIRDFKSLINGN